jgi:hypothetical protein
MASIRQESEKGIQEAKAKKESKKRKRKRNPRSESAKVLGTKGEMESG